MLWKEDSTDKTQKSEKSKNRSILDYKTHTFMYKMFEKYKNKTKKISLEKEIQLSQSNYVLWSIIWASIKSMRWSKLLKTFAIIFYQVWAEPQTASEEPRMRWNLPTAVFPMQRLKVINCSPSSGGLITDKMQRTNYLLARGGGGRRPTDTKFICDV